MGSAGSSYMATVRGIGVLCWEALMYGAAQKWPELQNVVLLGGAMGVIFWISAEGWAWNNRRRERRGQERRTLTPATLIAVGVLGGWVFMTIALGVQSQCMMAQNQLPSIRTGHGPDSSWKRKQRGRSHRCRLPEAYPAAAP